MTQIPGSYSQIDASGLAVVGLSATGIVALIGEAEGAEPGVVHGVTNPSKIAKLFRAGDLREAGNMAFDPSKDAQIPGGAQEVKFVKVNPATQSALTLDNADGDALILTSVDYGLFTTQTNVSVADGTTIGKAITVTFEDTVEEFDNIGGTAAFTALYTPGANGATTMRMDLGATGVDADFTLVRSGLQADYLGTTNSISGKQGDRLATITPGNAVQVVSANAGDVTQQVIVLGLNGAGSPQSETLTLNGTTAVVGVATWSTVQGIVLLTVTAGNVSVRDTAGPTVLYTITAGSKFTGGGCYTFSDNFLEAVSGTLSIVADAATTDVLSIAGQNHTPASAVEKITLNGTTPVVTTVRYTEVRYLALGYVAAARSITLSGLLLNSTDTVRVVSSNVGDTTQTATVYGLNTLGAVQSEVLTLNGTTTVVGTATWSEVHGIELSAVAVGTVTLRASSENILIFSLAAADRYGGFYPVDNLAVSGATLAYTSQSATDTRKALLVGLNAAGAPLVEKLTIDGTARVTAGTWSKITGVAMGHVQTGRSVTTSGEAIDLPVAQYATVKEVTDKIDSYAGWSVVVGANAGPIEIADMDIASAVSALTPGAAFMADLAYIVSTLNDQSQLVTAAVAVGATGAPSNTTAPVYLTGGVEGTTVFADWQAALDVLRDEFVNTIVVLTDDEAVHAAVVSHCQYMAGAGRRERDAVLGASSGITLTAAKARAVALNTRHARLLVQDVERFNTLGAREQFPPYFAAAIIAGMQAGSGVGLPLTFKFPNVLDVIGDDDTYTLQDDANELIDSGLLVFEQVPGVGFRVLRNVTTYLIDDNLAYTEASVNQAVNFAVYNLRGNLEAAVGQKAFAGTINAALGIAIKTLNQMIDAGALVSWRNLTIEIDADVMTVDVEVAPVLPVNFVKTTIHLVTASLSAAA